MSLRTFTFLSFCLGLLTAGQAKQTAAETATPAIVTVEGDTKKDIPPAATPAPAPKPVSQPVQATTPLALSNGTTPGKKVVVYVIPVRDQIAKPILYILRRGLKEAIEQKADGVVLDMDTPGGSLGVTFDIMEALEKFPGATITYVNKEAISAGAFISATTQEIWFAPHAVIGAAAPVTGEGKDIDVTMKQKIVSYLKARVRAMSEGKGYRGQVVSAMIDADFELKIGEALIKPKGELLSLTDTEANKTYGEPPQSLLGAGIAKDIDALLTAKYGAGNFQIKEFKVTWSEKLAQYLNTITPILMGLGLLCLFIEFKTPGFGFFGIAGIGLLAVVFLSNYVAGLSGHEPLVVFALGLLLVLLELVFFPGVAVVAMLGLVMMLGSLVWAMADLWPGVPVTTAWSTDVFVAPLQSLGLGLVIAVALAVALLKYLPSNWLVGRLAIQGASTNQGMAGQLTTTGASIVGREGVATTALIPSGHVEINDQRYEARVEIGSVGVGEKIRVVKRADFILIVEAIRS